MEYINYKYQTEPNVKEIRFDKDGNETLGLNYYAEIVSTDNGNSFRIKTYASSLHDPFGPYSKRESTLDLKLKKVSEKTFKNYVEYLKTKNLKYLSLAQRGFIDDRS